LQRLQGEAVDLHTGVQLVAGEAERPVRRDGSALRKAHGGFDLHRVLAVAAESGHARAQVFAVVGDRLRVAVSDDRNAHAGDLQRVDPDAPGTPLGLRLLQRTAHFTAHQAGVFSLQALQEV